MHRDRRGLAPTAANAKAAQHYDAAIVGYRAFALDTGAALKAARRLANRWARHAAAIAA